MKNARDYSQDIANLEKMINAIQSNVFFTISTIIALLALSVAIVGVALYFLAKQWVDTRVNKELEKIDERIKSIIKDNYPIKSTFGVIKVNGKQFTIPNVSNRWYDILVINVTDQGGEYLDKKVEFNEDNSITITLSQDVNFVFYSIYWIPKR